MIKINENICEVPHCEKTKLLVERGCPFCIEHSIKFKDFAPRYEVPSEIENILRTDEDLPNEFIINMISAFCDEEEKNTSNYEIINKKIITAGNNKLCYNLLTKIFLSLVLVKFLCY